MAYSTSKQKLNKMYNRYKTEYKKRSAYSQSKEKMYNAKVTEILAGAYKYGTDNIDNLTNECLDVTVGTLLKLGYVKSDDNSGFYVTNPKNNESMNNLIICVKYENGKVVTNVSN